MVNRAIGHVTFVQQILIEYGMQGLTHISSHATRFLGCMRCFKLHRRHLSGGISFISVRGLAEVQEKSGDENRVDPTTYDCHQLHHICRGQNSRLNQYFGRLDLNKYGLLTLNQRNRLHVGISRRTTRLLITIKIFRNSNVLQNPVGHTNLTLDMSSTYQK